MAANENIRVEDKNAPELKSYTLTTYELDISKPI